MRDLWERLDLLTLARDVLRKITRYLKSEDTIDEEKCIIREFIRKNNETCIVDVVTRMDTLWKVVKIGQKSSYLTSIRY